MPLLLTQQSRGSVGGLGKSLFMFRLPTASNMSLSSRPLPADQDVNMMVPTQQQPYQNNTSQPQQYLLATFALFSFVYSPLTQSYSSAIIIIIINGQALFATIHLEPMHLKLRIVWLVPLQHRQAASINGYTSVPTWSSLFSSF
ncbi:hypothetical protein M378DRAFT_380775 [Amanita muscaria Koide BX008]|uniref:Uncharacterized protein n=1 Tax=Amanita muscaria (strain Koide BX008) TaxID=946122 RepID=A0A0C2WLK7_AMAMK|nr:hypothetical protein M378DRAFT_380775 [Amanita muscaria Koide BX008]